jgi:hypothetical protein
MVAAVMSEGSTEPTREAVRVVASLLEAAVTRGEDRERAGRRVLRCVAAVLAPDLFAQIVDLRPHAVELLALDWSKVEPLVFGTLFLRSLDARRRHALGAHFTSEAEIHKVVTPTLVRPWRERLARARTESELRRLARELAEIRVLDPACGSGNFLSVAYRALKRLETEILLRIHGEHAGVESRRHGAAATVGIAQLHGIDVAPFAVELAKVELLLARKLALDEAREALREHPEAQLGLVDRPRIESLDDNLRCDDALFCVWPRADVILGNPPYQSMNKAQRELGRAYLDRVHRAYPEVPGRADYCVYWFRRAHDELPAGGRAGLVGTNTIRHNASRRGGLDYIVGHGGTITEAVSTQVWPGDAVVHVSIVNWIKGAADGPKTLHEQRGDTEGAPWARYELPTIGAALSARVDLTTARDLSANTDPKTTFQGQTPGHRTGFVIPAALARQWIAADAANAEVLFAYLTGDDLLGDPGGTPERLLLDFGSRDMLAASRYRMPFEHVARSVLPARAGAAAEEATRNAEAPHGNRRGRANQHHASFLRHWWLPSFPRRDMLAALGQLDRYIACSRVTRRPIFEVVSGSVRPGDALQIFALGDDYSFGILQSDAHWQWFQERCSGLKIDPRYTSSSVYGSFPWPQAAGPAQVHAVAAAGAELRALRRSIADEERIGLRRLYRRLASPGPHPLQDAHQALDRAVRAAYGMRTDEDPLQFLLDLNHEVAGCEALGQRVVGPGLPA